MHVKYFQPLADIERHYETILMHMDRGSGLGKKILETWGIDISEQELIKEEIGVLRYLIACQSMLSYHEDAIKPTIEVANRCFNRHIKFIENITGCNQYTASKIKSKLIRKEYKACRHYIFKFSLKAWYDNLPDAVQTYSNKYSKHIG